MASYTQKSNKHFNDCCKCNDHRDNCCKCNNHCDNHCDNRCKCCVGPKGATGPQGPVAVSYTHLDVYKRQGGVRCICRCP